MALLGNLKRFLSLAALGQDSADSKAEGALLEREAARWWVKARRADPEIGSIVNELPVPPEGTPAHIARALTDANPEASMRALLDEALSNDDGAHCSEQHSNQLKEEAMHHLQGLRGHSSQTNSPISVSADLTVKMERDAVMREALRQDHAGAMKETRKYMRAREHFFQYLRLMEEAVEGQVGPGRHLDAFMHLFDAQYLDEKASLTLWMKIASDCPRDRSARVFELLGSCHGFLNRWDDAVLWMRKALDADPDLYEAQYLLAVGLTGRGGMKAALKAFEMYLKLCPPDSRKQVNALYKMACIYFTAHNDSKVAEFYEKAKAREPELSRLWGKYEDLNAERHGLALWEMTMSRAARVGRSSPAKGRGRRSRK
eukprot:scaffold251009_cov42-Prasinocladus_malaysianus.AAC.1